MPSPGPIGLEAKEGAGKKTPSGSNEQIVRFARQNMGRRVGDGECFALADRALRHAGAKSAADYGPVTPDGDYVWGDRVNLGDVRPGDIVQFRDYRYDRTVETPDRIETDFQERPHHTAIVESVGEQGSVTVLEQNVPVGSPVQRRQLFFSNFSNSTGGRTTKITLQGQFWFYRPQRR